MQKRITMKVSPTDENNNNKGTGRGYKEPVHSAMLRSSSLPLTAALRTRAPNDVRNENSDSTSHSNEDEGFSQFLAYLGGDDNTKKDQWQCSTCSYINKNPLHLTCDICGTVRVGQEPEDDIIKGPIDEGRKGMGIEVCEDEDKDAPIPAAQIAARYESMEETAKKPELNEDDDDSPPLPPWQIGCENKDLATKKSYETTSAPPSSSDCQPPAIDEVIPSSTSDEDLEQNMDEVVPPSTSDEDSEQNTPNSGQPQVEIIIHRPPPPSMLPRHSDDEEEEPSADLPSLPQIEATAVEDVVYDAIAVRANDIPYPCWKRKSIFVGTSLVIGTVMAAVIAASVGSREDDNNGHHDVLPTLPTIGNSTTTTATTTSNIYYYSDRDISRCDNDPSGPPNAKMMQPLFDNLEECCEAEFDLQEKDDCLMNSRFIWKQQGQTITGESAGDWSGYSLSLSSDGETLAIGAPGEWDNEDKSGYAKVYHRDGDNWELEQTVKGEVNGDLLGVLVSLSKDGKTLAVGAPGHWKKADRPGYVKVYHRAGSNWNQLGQAIKGEALGDMFGSSVSISTDGKTLAVGAYTNDNDNGQYSGHVRVFSLDDDNGSNWNQLGQDIEGEAAFDNSGKSVSLSPDGRTVAIGASGNDGNGEDSGHVRVYQMDEASSSWQQLGQDIDGEAAGDMSGESWSVSLSEDGKIVAIGAYYNDGNGSDSGHVRVYYMDDSSSLWKQFGRDIDGEAAYDWSGVSVSLSADGKSLAIGANGNDSNGDTAGVARIYYIMEEDDSSLNWKQLGQDIYGESAGDQAGWSVSLSSDGKTIAVGSEWNADNGEKSGHVRVFNIGPTEIHTATVPDNSVEVISEVSTTTSKPTPAPLLWKQQGHSIAGNAAGDWSGYSVSLSSGGETLAIGSPGNHTFPSDIRQGYAKVYQRSSDGGDWKLDQTILGDADADVLGQSVALSGDGKTVAVGAPGHWKRNDRPGYVKVYHIMNEGYWKQLGQVLTGEAIGNQFGQSVSLSSNGKTLAVGANTNDNENGEAAGHVRVFGLDEPGSTWKQLGQDIDGEAAFDNSGKSVSLSSDGRTVAIGASMNEGNGDEAGHVRVYQIDAFRLSWKQLGQDIDGEAAGDESGASRSVSLSADGKIVAIGAYENDNENGFNSGHVRVYNMDEDTSGWKQIGQDIDGEVAYDQSGIAVSLSEDGKVLAIGANSNDRNGAGAGHVRVYHIDATGSSWAQLGEGIDGESAGDNSGWSVSLSADGKTVAIGSIRNDYSGEKSGHVRVFSIE